jgi:NADH:ubiquinone oxidoreductase subunit 5 (subunit L)/multisubunit Na+/H+ antiporter MnhA subunit
VLGLGACLLLRARGADTWAAIALAAALLHTLNHAVFKALLFLGAGSFERAAGSLALDRLGGLCSGCRGRAERSSSALSPSPGCHR